MTIEVEISEGLHRLKVSGELNIYTAVEFKQQLLEQLARAPRVEIDLSQVSEIDTAGFQVLYLARREASRDDKPLRLAAASRAVKDVIQAYHMAAYFEHSTKKENA